MLFYSRVASPVTLIFLAFLWAVALHGPDSISHLLVMAASALGFGACAASMSLRARRVGFTWGRAVVLAGAIALGATSGPVGYGQRVSASSTESGSKTWISCSRCAPSGPTVNR